MFASKFLVKNNNAPVELSRRLATHLKNLNVLLLSLDNCNILRRSNSHLWEKMPYEMTIKLK